jgi:O-antigen ligase
MSAAAPREGRALARGAAATVLPLLGAAALGAVYAYSAFGFNPLLLPAAVAMVALAAVSLTRPEIGVAAGLLLLPLGRLGVTGNPPWAVPALWSTWLFVLALRPSSVEGRAVGRLPRGGIVVLIFLGVTLIAFAIAPVARGAFPILRTDVTGLMLFYAIARLVRTRPQVMWTLAGAVASATIVAGAALFALYTGRTGSVGFLTSTGDLVNRLTVGTFTQPNSLGGFLVLLAPFALAAALVERRGRLVSLGALLVISIGVYETFSRGALMGLAAVPFVFLRGRRLLFVVPLVVVAVLVVTPGLVTERFATVNQSGGDLATRQDFWNAGLHIWADNPVLGVGLGGFPNAYSQARVPAKQFLPDSVLEPPPHAHNLFIQMLAEQGVLGLLALLAVLGVAVRMALELRRHAERWLRVMGSGMLAALVAFLIHNMFDVTLVQETGIDFWALLGLLSALTAIARDRSDEPQPA